MKVVKWVGAKYDKSEGNPRLLYRVIGEDEPEGEERGSGQTAEEAVIESIRRNRFKFGGTYHQYGEHGLPMFEDGSVFFVSMRAWGDVMARAWSGLENHYYDYLDFAWENDMPNDGGNVPKSDTDFVKLPTTTKEEYMNNEEAKATLNEYAKRAEECDGDKLIALTREFLEKECGDLGAAALKDGKLIPWIASFWVVYNHPVDDAEREDAERGLLSFIGKNIGSEHR